jgi:hypothetical protein
MVCPRRQLQPADEPADRVRGDVGHRVTPARKFGARLASPYRAVALESAPARERLIGFTLAIGEEVRPYVYRFAPIDPL